LQWSEDLAQIVTEPG